MTCQRLDLFQPFETRTRALAENNKAAGDLLKSQDLQEGTNEFFLFHGTCPAATDAICEGNFQKSLASSGGLYGPGFYFAEASSKADEYASDDREGIYKGLYAMLLCRVTCGALLYNDQLTPDVDTLTTLIEPQGPYHSLLGDREKVRGTYREFVIYDNEQIYPEYIVIYRRGD